MFDLVKKIENKIIAVQSFYGNAVEWKDEYELDCDYSDSKDTIVIYDLDKNGIIIDADAEDYYGEGLKAKEMMYITSYIGKNYVELKGKYQGCYYE